MVSGAVQNSYNYDVSQYDQMPWQVSAALQRAKNQLVLDQPILSYNERFATDPLFLVDFLRRVSDFMGLNPHPLWGSHNQNRADLYAVANGKINNARDYDAIMQLFGDKSAIPIKDNHFFHGAEKTLTSQIITQPFVFSSQNVSTDFAKQSILEDARKGAKMGVQAMLQGLLANGDGGAAPLIDPSVKLPKTPEDWLDFATGQEQVEGIIWKLLQHINLTHNFQNLARHAVKHKFRINAEFGMVDVANGEVIPKVLHPSQVRWMAGRPVENLQDPAVLGVQVNEYMTPTELVNTYGVGRLSTGTGVKGVLRYVEKLFEKGVGPVGYDPSGNYWSSRGISADMGNYCLDDKAKEYTTTQVNWMNNFFYPNRAGGKLLVNILVQKNYFLMQREKRFTVEKISRTGERSAATDKELKNWQTTRADLDYDIDFTPVGKDTPNRSNIKTYSRPQVWQFTRVGHDGFIDIGPYKYQPDFDEDTQERPRVYWPVVGQISYEKSMVRLGEDDATRANVLKQKIDMFLADLGYEEALIVDDVHGKEPISYRYNARQTGLVRIDSSKYNPGNPAMQLHLKTVKLGNPIQQIMDLFAQIRNLEIGYELRTGAGPDVQGQTSPYASNASQQQNILGQQKLNVEFNWEHAQFMNQFLQACADVSKFHYAKDGQVLILLSKNEQRILTLTWKLRLADFSIKLESGQLLADKKKLLDQIVSQLMQSGGIDQWESLMQIPLNDNPAEGMAKARQISAQIRETAGKQAEAGQQQAQAVLADNEKKRAHEILLKQMEINAMIRVASIKAGSEDARNEFEGLMHDVTSTTSQEDMILQAQLENEKAATQAGIEQQMAPAETK